MAESVLLADDVLHEFKKDRNFEGDTSAWILSIMVFTTSGILSLLYLITFIFAIKGSRFSFLILLTVMMTITNLATIA